MSGRLRRFEGRLDDNPWVRAGLRTRIRWAVMLTAWLALLAVGLRWLLVSMGVRGPGPAVFGVVAARGVFIWSLLWPRRVTGWTRQLLRPRVLLGLVLAVALITSLRVSLL
jgi:Flp pilus assembly protein TadB